MLSAKVRVRIRVCPKNSQNAVFQDGAAMMLNGGQYGKQSFEWTPKQFAADRYVVTTELLRDGKLIDVISHELGVLPSEKNSRDDYEAVGRCGRSGSHY